MSKKVKNILENKLNHLQLLCVISFQAKSKIKSKWITENLHYYLYFYITLLINKKIMLSYDILDEGLTNSYIFTILFL